MLYRIMLGVLLLTGASVSLADVTIQENTTGFCGMDGTIDSNSARSPAPAR